MQLLRRLDHWFKQQRLPLRVYFKKSEFRIITLAPIRLVIHRGLNLAAADIQWTAFRQQVFGNQFSTVDVALFLGVSKSKALQLIKNLLQRREIEKVGDRRGTYYRFAKSAALESVA